MNRQQRAKRQVLERTIADMDGAERRALADLHRAGYRFQSLRKAREHLASLRTIDRLQQDPDALAEALTNQTRKDTQ